LDEGACESHAEFEMVDPLTHRFRLKVTMLAGTEIELHLVDPHREHLRRGKSVSGSFLSPRRAIGSDVTKLLGF
jgi:hypothetical protein